jgi:signal recognition particle receptor subunit beta
LLGILTSSRADEYVVPISQLCGLERYPQAPHMTTYDPLNRCLVVRVVYDGPGASGKTTNVQEICRRYPVSKRTELYTPGALKGRTMFFDWLELDLSTGGKLPIRVQLVSVTGQEMRSYRRRPLIRSADSVVFVCDSRPEHLAYARQRLLLLQRYLRERRPAVPYLVQANKQDMPGALPPNELMEQLRWRKEIPALAAVASSGQGVIETFQQAAKAAARYACSVVTMVGVKAIEATPETADQVLDDLLMLEDQIETPQSDAYEDPDAVAEPDGSLG